MLVPCIRPQLFDTTCYWPADGGHFCIVPHSGYDAVLFAAVAIVLACVLQGKFFSLWIFVAGEANLKVDSC